MRLNHSVFTRMFYRLVGRDPMAEYYRWLSKFGRVADGHILDFQQDESGLTIFYRYKVANVDTKLLKGYPANNCLAKTPTRPARASSSGSIPGAGLSIVP